MLSALIALVLLALTAVSQIGETVFFNTQNDLSTLADKCINVVETAYNHMSADELKASVSIIEAHSIRAIVLDESDTVQYDSLSLLNGRCVVPSSGLFALQNEISSCPSYVYFQDFEGGKLVLISNVESEYAFFLQRVIQILTLTGILFIVAFITVVLITRAYAVPVEALNAGIQRMGKGDFSTRVSVDGNNEFSDLAQAFNDMMCRIETLDRSRNKFVSNASHELKTPLATMKILIQSILFQEEMDPAMTKEFLNDVDHEIDRLSSVVTDLLTLVGMDSGKTGLNLTELDLTALVSENVKRLSPLARRLGIELEINGSEKLLMNGDSSKLTQVFYNLIDNALKYTPRGGSVKVEVSKIGGKAVVKVKDNGIGISQEDQLHLFDRFYRVDKARSRDTGGTGLGLSIVKQIILMHNGSVDIDSELNKGSTFIVQLPVTAKAAGGKQHG